jgi:hypothetical protein
MGVVHLTKVCTVALEAYTEKPITSDDNDVAMIPLRGGRHHLVKGLLE